MQIKETLFSFSDLHKEAVDNPTRIDNIIFARGLKAKALMQNSIFQEAVSNFYLGLVLAEDEIDVKDNLDVVKDLRLQRRLLRQVVATLDNMVHAMESREQELAQEKLDSQLNPQGEKNAFELRH